MCTILPAPDSSVPLSPGYAMRCGPSSPVAACPAAGCEVHITSHAASSEVLNVHGPHNQGVAPRKPLCHAKQHRQNPARRLQFTTVQCDMQMIVREAQIVLQQPPLEHDGGAATVAVQHRSNDVLLLSVQVPLFSSRSAPRPAATRRRA